MSDEGMKSITHFNSANFNQNYNFFIKIDLSLQVKYIGLDADKI
jgi:hypothetical protein